MITREQYMENSQMVGLHHQYYLQFVTPETIRFVENCIGLNRLKASECPNLNDVVRWDKWGRTWIWDKTPMDSALALELGECVSMSTHTCVGKAAARFLLEKEAAFDEMNSRDDAN